MKKDTMKMQTVLEFLEDGMEAGINRLLEGKPLPAEILESLDTGLLVNLLKAPSDDIIRIFGSFSANEGHRIAVAMLAAYGLGQRDYAEALMEYSGGD